MGVWGVMVSGIMVIPSGVAIALGLINHREEFQLRPAGVWDVLILLNQLFGSIYQVINIVQSAIIGKVAVVSRLTTPRIQKVAILINGEKFPIKNRAYFLVKFVIVNYTAIVKI